MKEMVKCIPFIGSDLYLQAFLEEKKIEIFKKRLDQASKGTVTQQQEFLDEFQEIILKKNDKKPKMKKKHL